MAVIAADEGFDVKDAEATVEDLTAGQSALNYDFVEKCHILMDKRGNLWDSCRIRTGLGVLGL